jgi:protein-tyrosine-phosphatase
VGELTQLVGEPQNLVSYHLRELRDAGLVSSRRSSFDGRDACAAGAALQPGLRRHANAVRVMADRGIDISGRTTKHLGRFAGTHFDSVITLCDRVREVCPEFPGQPTTAHWSIPDPAAEGATDETTYPAFERTACELEARLGPLIARLSTTEGGHAHAE